MKKLLSILLAVTMLIVPVVSSSCFATKDLNTSTGSQGECQNHSFIGKLAKVAVIVGVVGFVSIYALETKSGNGEAGKIFGEYVGNAYNKVKGIFSNFTKDYQSSEFINGVKNYFYNAKELVLKNIETFTKAFAVSRAESNQEKLTGVTNSTPSSR